MKQSLSAILVLALVALISQPGAAQQAQPSPTPGGRGGGTPPPIQAKPEELAKIKEKTEQIDALVKDLKAKRANPELVGDVEVYAHAGKMLLEYPDMFANQNAIEHAFTTLDQGIERGKQLQANQPQWNQGKRRIHAYTSEIDGAVLPYGVTLPDNYDPGKPTRLYVWLHGRQNTTTETEFIYGFLSRRGAGNPPVADQGQIQLDCFGRINGAGWHWAGEADVFESIAAVKKRFGIDEKRVMIRGFSQGGEGAWHISLHHPDRFAAAEIGAGTVSRTAQRPGLTPYQLATLRIWENISEWALNIHNLPLAGHDGENDPGQLESSLRARAQLEKEGFPSVGDPDYLRSQGAPGLWMVSKETGHGTSPLVRQRLDAFLKEHGDKGQISPDHIRFLTYTTRYNRSYWVSLDGLEKHYERAEVDAQRTDGGASYDIKTKNLTRLVLHETEHVREIKIDGQTLKVKAGPEITLDKNGGAWKIARNGPERGLHKTHALQGPIDDAFLDPFLLVRPTGKPWNNDVNEQALRTRIRAPVGTLFSRPPLCEGRQGRHRSRLRQVSRCAVRRSGQQQMDRENNWQAAGQVDPTERHLGRADFPIERELSSHDLPEPAQSREIRRTQHRPHHRRPRLQRRLRHAALGRLRHRQSETGRSRPGDAHGRPLRRTLAVGEITGRPERTNLIPYL